MADSTRFDEQTLERAARRAYELGRLTFAMKQAVVVAMVAGAIGVLVAGNSALFWLPIPFVAWAFAAHRGGAFRAGAVRGLAAGLVALVMPLAWLRPCCAAGAAGESCCAAPGTCTLAGVLLGAAFALLLPRTAASKHLEAAAGLVFGAVAIGVLRCHSLLLGETLGLFAGLSGALIALGLARAVVERATR
jgi:hypothetical protein